MYFMKYLYALLISCLLSGCPVYDPASATINILNYSDSAIYVSQSCDGSFDCKSPLKLFLVVKVPRTDSRGNKMKDTIAPNYRINAYSYGIIYADGSPEKPLLPCEGNNLTLFYIKEITMRTKTWEEICKNQLFVKKVILTKEALDSADWRIIYEPSNY